MDRFNFVFIIYECGFWVFDYWKDLILFGFLIGIKNFNCFENLKYSMYLLFWICVNSLMVIWYIFVFNFWFICFVGVFIVFIYLCVCLFVYKLYYCLFCKIFYYYIGDMEGYEIFSNVRNLYKDGFLFNKGFFEMIEIWWE